MDIHEYQAKEILSGFGVEVAPGALAYSPEQAAYRARELGGNAVVGVDLDYEVINNMLMVSASGTAVTID